MKLIAKSIVLAALVTAAAPKPLTASEPAKAPCCTTLRSETPAEVSDTSLYQLDSFWTTDAAKKIKLGELGGRPQVITMFFASCIYACPILTHDMKKIEAALPEELRSEVGFALISIDSEGDTPEVLAAYRNRHGLPENWTLLRADPDDVLELGALLGVKFKKEANGQFAHSNIITVLNAGGEIVFQQPGLNTDPAPTVAAIRKIIGGSIR